MSERPPLAWRFPTWVAVALTVLGPVVFFLSTWLRPGPRDVLDWFVLLTAVALLATALGGVRRLIAGRGWPYQVSTALQWCGLGLLGVAQRASASGHLVLSLACSVTALALILVGLVALRSEASARRR